MSVTVHRQNPLPRDLAAIPVFVLGNDVSAAIGVSQLTCVQTCMFPILQADATHLRVLCQNRDLVNELIDFVLPELKRE